MNRFAVKVCVLAVLGFLTAACSGTDGAASPSTPLDTSAFSGQWFQHAGALNIGTSGDVDLTYQVEQPPTSSVFPELKLRLESVVGDTATAVVVSSNDTAVAVGSRFTFRRAEPGMVVTTPDGSTLIWCDLPHRDLGSCGA